MRTMVSGSAGHLGEALMRTLELLDHWDGDRGTTSPASSSFWVTPMNFAVPWHDPSAHTKGYHEEGFSEGPYPIGERPG